MLPRSPWPYSVITAVIDQLVKWPLLKADKLPALKDHDRLLPQSLAFSKVTERNSVCQSSAVADPVKVSTPVLPSQESFTPVGSGSVKERTSPD